MFCEVPFVYPSSDILERIQYLEGGGGGAGSLALQKPHSNKTVVPLNTNRTK